MLNMAAKKIDLSKISQLGDTDSGIVLTGLEQEMADIAAQFVLDAVNNLNHVDRVSSGSLSDSIQPSPVRREGDKLIVDVSVLDYYKFVDEGVRGWKDKKGSNSRFAFKKRTLGDGNFVNSLKGWLQKEGAKITDNSKNKVAIVSREAKRIKHRSNDPLTERAIAIAAIIKRQGLAKTNFWTMAVNKLQESLKTQIVLVVKEDVINSIIS
jgi:hypothetical protein